ncbi:putative fmn-binding split barrel-related protein [Erysiphe neolycopersici]|uniref:Putative fmn-binding split barrel-related protein n=1 Tax=Erysiphe neolycopersici TaxID=212602 RepID=A0A420HRS5_9PEZI|nr:putative fmn-binding split barrel-related protein [Erysiphe neolycopersici]
MYLSFFLLMSFIFLALNLQQTICKPINTTSVHRGHDNGDKDVRIPTVQESAVLGRRILRLTPMATFSTVFPLASESNASSSKELSLQKALPAHYIEHLQEHRPQGLENTPIGLIDYVADCEVSGNPTVLAINIATTFKNIAAGSKVSISFSWTPPHVPLWSSIFLNRQHPARHSAANLPRFALFGHLERIDAAEVEELSIKECFTTTHPDAKSWLPGNRIHTSEWQRFVVENIYWIGGFGDRAYIGWIPVDVWKNVWYDDIDRARLPGEKQGWKDIIHKWLGNK